MSWGHFLCARSAPFLPPRPRPIAPLSDRCPTPALRPDRAKVLTYFIFSRLWTKELLPRSHLPLPHTHQHYLSPFCPTWFPCISSSPSSRSGSPRQRTLVPVLLLCLFFSGIVWNTTSSTLALPASIPFQGSNFPFIFCIRYSSDPHPTSKHT